MSRCKCCSNCDQCGKHLCPECIDGYEGLIFRCDSRDVCDACRDEIIEKHRTEVAAHAALVKLTGRVEVFAAKHRYAPTPKEYEAGHREVYTSKSVRAYNWHSPTKHDELIKPLHRDDDLDQAYYAAVRERVEVLLEFAELEAPDAELLSD